MMSKSDDLYEILQVHHAAEPEVIEAAYRRLLRMYHPDVNKTAHAHDITVRLNAAYEVLRDPAKRTDYDRQRGSQTGYDRSQWEWERQAEQERQARTERQQRERERHAREECERWAREVQAERERQEYLERERQAQTEARDKQERKERTKSLFRAVRTGDVHQARNLISSGADVNADDSTGWTPLHTAALFGKTEIALVLISAGADVNARDNTGRLPEDCARENNPAVAAIRRVRMEAQAEKARRRQERQMQVEKAKQRQTRQMFQVVKEGDLKAVMVFVNAGVDVNSTTGGSDYTFLHWAAWEGHSEIALALIFAGADVNRTVAGNTPLDLAMKRGHTATAAVIRERGGAL